MSRLTKQFEQFLLAQDPVIIGGTWTRFHSKKSAAISRVVTRSDAKRLVGKKITDVLNDLQGSIKSLRETVDWIRKQHSTLPILVSFNIELHD